MIIGQSRFHVGCITPTISVHDQTRTDGGATAMAKQPTDLQPPVNRFAARKPAETQNNCSSRKSTFRIATNLEHHV